MPLNIARDPMRQPAVSSGPTYDRSGQPSVPLRVRGLIGEVNDQAWFSSLASSRLLLREQDGRGRRTETAMSGIAPEHGC
jgi:hypothetical protein